jgi:threonylcarbamoyladenosine tRNA methylthiotransferase MtaB
MPTAPRMLRFTIKTLGCKTNQYDSQALAAALGRIGLAPAGPAHRADLLVVNTCCVTATAMAKSRNAIRRVVRAHPGAAVFLTGCYSDYDQKQLYLLLDELGVGPGLGRLAGHHSDLAAELADFVDRLADPKRTTASGNLGRSVPENIRARRLAAVKGNICAASKLPPIRRFAGRQRAFVKVQDGCDAMCSYCIVPYTRPKVWSRHVEEILDECGHLVRAGHKEIVLSGVFLGAYGRPTAVRRNWPEGETSLLPDLLRRVCDIDGLWRVRLSSLEPGDVTDELLEVMASRGKVAPHLHLPLQSGSPEMLRRANRQYTAEQYRQCLRRIGQALDRPAITTDIIVGLPGETEEDFALTLDLARQAGFAKIHAFPFSPIEPTPAWHQREDAPPPAVVKARMARLARVEAATAMEYAGQFLGCKVEGIVERSSPKAGWRQALTDRYLTVRFTPDQAGRALTGRVVRLAVDAVTPDGLYGSRA